MYFTETEKSLKAEYRRLAMKNHPDRGGSTAAFQEISAAYESILSIIQKCKPKDSDKENVGTPFELVYFSFFDYKLGYINYKVGFGTYRIPLEARGRSVQIQHNGKYVQNLYLSPRISRLYTYGCTIPCDANPDDVIMVSVMCERFLPFGVIQMTVGELLPLVGQVRKFDHGTFKVYSKEFDASKWEIDQIMFDIQFEKKPNVLQRCYKWFTVWVSR